MSEATVIALGFFDGVHLATVRFRCEKRRSVPASWASRLRAFTFDRSPKEFVTGVPVLPATSAAERAGDHP